MKFKNYKEYDKNVMSIIMDYKAEMEWFEYRHSIKDFENWTVLEYTNNIPANLRPLYQKYKDYDYCMNCGISSNNGYVRDLGACWITCKKCYVVALDSYWSNDPDAKMKVDKYGQIII